MEKRLGLWSTLSWRLRGALASTLIGGLLAGCSGGGGGDPPVAAAPVIAAQPQPATVSDGQSASFTVVATGEALRYQWQKNGVLVAGATATTLSITSVALTDTGARYRVVVSNASGDSISNEATLTVSPVALSIVAQPIAASVSAGQTATFSVTSAGSAPLRHQWRRNGVDISGATASSYTTAPVSVADSGSLFSVVVSNTGSSITSAAAALTVMAAPPAPTGARLSLSASSTLALRADGGLLAWGSNSAGQLGAGALVAGTAARLVTSQALAFSGNDSGGLVLKSAGQVQGWGTNSGGWLGGTIAAGTTPIFATPVAVAWPRPALAVSAGLKPFGRSIDFAFALLNDGSVWHLPGDRTLVGNDTSYGPAQVPGLFDIVALSDGHGDAYAVRNDGSVWSITLTISSGGGPDYYRARATQVGALSNVAAVSCGTNHCLALLKDGTLRAWGEGRAGELGQGVALSSAAPVTVSGLSNVTHIAVTSWFAASVARSADGRVWSWGRGELSARPSVRSGALLLPPAHVAVPTEVPSLAATAEIACSQNHCAARRSDGSVWTWGSNLYEQLGVTGPDQQEPVQATGINLN